MLLVTLHHIHLRFVLNDYPVENVLPGVLSRVVYVGILRRHYFLRDLGVSDYATVYRTLG